MAPPNEGLPAEALAREPSAWNRIKKGLVRLWNRLGWIVLWICAVALLIPHGYAVFKGPKGDYGIGVLRENFDCGAKGAAFMIFLVQLPINALAALLVYTSGHIRIRTQRPDVVPEPDFSHVSDIWRLSKYWPDIGWRYRFWRILFGLLTIPANLL